MKISDGIKAFFAACAPFFLGVLAFFSYSFFQKQKEAEARAIDSNADDAAELKAIEKTVKDLKTATKETQKKVEEAETIVIKPIEPTNTVEESVDAWNKHK